jgi:hypothetical protein
MSESLTSFRDKFLRVQSKAKALQQTYGKHVSATASKALSALGTGVGAAVDGYLADPPANGTIPIAKIGPAPINLSASLALSALGYAGSHSNEAWGPMGHALGDGLFSAWLYPSTRNLMHEHKSTASKSK